MLRKDGYDVAHAGEFMAGADDRAVAAEAASRDAILLTFDRDFGELTFYRQMHSPGIVLFRLGKRLPREAFPLVQTFLASPPPLRGFFAVVSMDQVRRRPLLRIVDPPT